VHEKLALLRKSGAIFGFTCMVSAKSRHAVTSPEFVRAQADAGCVVGIYSRYFPLASSSSSELALDAAELSDYQRAFEAARADARLPLLDLDEVEQHTGCHSRAGESVYIDGISGQVSPCLRVPFSPPECRLDGARSLAEVLAHPFFVEYRKRSGNCPSWCGANLEGELAQVGKLLDDHAARPPRLEGYQLRSRDGAAPVRRLPVVP
jgi:hypothetical protein